MSTLLDAPAALRVDEIVSADGLEALRPEWLALWERSPRAGPFQHPDWLLAWWRWFGCQGLWTLAVRREGRLVGLMPLFVWCGAGPRQVTPVGNGVSDRLDLLAAPGLERDAADAVLSYLAQNTDRWDTADFRDLPPDSALLDVSIEGIAAMVEDDVPISILPLPARVEELGTVLSARFLRNLRSRARRLAREADVSFQAADERTLGGLLDALFRLHRARWEMRGEPGVLDDAFVQGFHREAAAAFLRRGMLRLYALRVNGEPAAVYYGFLAKRRAYFYLPGFDPALARHGVGKAIVMHAVEEAVRDGAAVFDFLRGGEAYKEEWSAEHRPQRRLRLRVVR